MNLAPSGLLVIVTGACESFTIVAQPENMEIMIAVKKYGRNLFKRSPLHDKPLQSIHQILSNQIRIPCQYLKRFVACDDSEFHRIKTLLKKPAARLMPEIPAL
jgi:hypothetical protein